MADTTIFALAGSLLIALTLLPVLCAWVLRRGVRERGGAWEIERRSPRKKTGRGTLDRKNALVAAMPRCAFV